MKSMRDIKLCLIGFVSLIALSFVLPASAAHILFDDDGFYHGASIGSGVALNETVNPPGTDSPGFESDKSLMGDLAGWGDHQVLTGNAQLGAELHTLEFRLFVQPHEDQNARFNFKVRLNRSNNPDYKDEPLFGVQFPHHAYSPTDGDVLVDGEVPTELNFPGNQWMHISLDLNAIVTDFDPQYDMINKLFFVGRGQTNTFFVDNVKAIPEPGTLALLGLAGLVLLKRRRV